MRPPLTATPGGVVPSSSPLAATPGSAPPGDIKAQAEAFVQANPQVITQIQQAVKAAMASGELTQEELAIATQLTSLALQDPSAYPKLRTFAIQQKIASPSDLPQKFDPGLLFVLFTVLQSILPQGGQAQAAPQAAPPGVQGGYVVPDHVVRAKGTDFFDQLARKHAPTPSQG